MSRIFYEVEQRVYGGSFAILSVVGYVGKCLKQKVSK